MEMHPSMGNSRPQRAIDMRVAYSSPVSECYRGCMTTASDRSILNETGKSAVHTVAERGAYDPGGT